MRTSRRPTKFDLRAEPQKPVEIVLHGEATLTAAAGDGKGPRRFSMIAYDGGPMRPKVDPPLPHPIVVDLASLDVSKQRYPALKDHDPKALVGHTDKVAAGSNLTAEGVISGTGAAATEVVASADNGFTWGVSMGAIFGEMKLLPAGQSVRVNGRSVDGPVYLARKGRLRELSFLTLAADDDTAALIAAEAARKGEVMDFAAWLKANGFQPEDQLSDGQKTILRAQFKSCKGIELDAGVKTQMQAMLDASTEDEAPAPKPKKGKKAGATIVAAAPEDETTPTGGDGADGTSELKAELAGIRREQAVYRLCGEDHADIAEKAIKAGWSDDVIKMAIEAAELKATLPKGIQVRTGTASDGPSTGMVLEAACAIAGDLPDIEKAYDTKALNVAASRFRHGIGLQELLLEAAWSNGYTGRSFRQDHRGVLQAAFTVRADGFSSNNISGILSNIANKFLLMGFMTVEDTWKQISSTRPVNDFKTITSYRLTGDNEYEEVGPAGEIKHGKLGNENFTNQAKTFAKMLAITRQDQINDDMGALVQAPQRLGRGGALKLNKTFWTAWLDDSTFFTSGNLNYAAGTNTVLGIDSLTAAELLFLNQVDADGQPLGLAAEILLTPNALATKATSLSRDTEIRDTTASTKYTTANPHAGKWRSVRSSYLSNTTLTGYSTTAWYLIANPAAIAAIEVCFLNGRQEPTVETASTDFDTLGIQMRGFHDFGVSKQDSRAAVKMKGAA